jgi:RNA polymerase sigma-70 factor (ECF subfamily)
MTACRNRAINVLRDSERAKRQMRALQPLLCHAAAGQDAGPVIADDRLRLITMCCHPLLTTRAQVALTLRLVAGLTTAEIASGLHQPISTIAQRIVRAKRTLAANQVTFATDEPDLPSRLPSVLDVVYLIFNEGYLASHGDALLRDDLAREAGRLARLLIELVPAEAEAWGLRALLSFQLSRWNTRADSHGGLLTLDLQDRGQWDRELIDDGALALRHAAAADRPGPLVLQARLAQCHATAPSFDATDWRQIVALYDELAALQDTAVIALNRAVAVAMATGPGAALPLLNRLVTDESLRGSHRVWSVRADLHRRLGDAGAAIADYDRALELVTNDAEFRYLATARSRVSVGCCRTGRQEGNDRDAAS